MYTQFARAIHNGENRQPTFETAVDLHRLIDAISQASDNGRDATFG
jgi:predicted dehydrogenase